MFYYQSDYDYLQHFVHFPALSFVRSRTRTTIATHTYGWFVWFERLRRYDPLLLKLIAAITLEEKLISTSQKKNSKPVILRWSKNIKVQNNNNKRCSAREERKNKQAYVEELVDKIGGGGEQREEA